jgi:hypothetical protein
MLQQAHEHGHDVRASTRAIVAQTPLGESPARDLRYRIVSRLELPIDATSPLDIPAMRQPREAHHPSSSPTIGRRMPPTGRR